MPRNITAAQTRAQDFDKSDALTQTNQTKHNFFFCMAQKTKQLFSEDLKLNKNPGTFF